MRRIMPLLIGAILMLLSGLHAQIPRVSSPASTAQFKTTLYSLDDLSIADGNTVVFDPAYSNNVDGDDVPKIPNPGENFGILRNGVVLVIEGRQPIVSKDTIFFKMWNMVIQDYQLEFTPTGFSAGTTAFLQDKFLGINTPINLTTLSTFNFTINSNPASSAMDRFRVVFNTSVIPVMFVNLSAFQALRDVKINWQINTEMQVSHFEVEHSFNGIKFEKISNNILSTGSSIYSWNDDNPDPGANFYRIKAIDLSGQPKYSGIVKVVLDNNFRIISVSPNPIIGNCISFQFINEPVGIYDMQLYDAEGKLLWGKKIDHKGGSSIHSIELTNKLFHGIYYAQIILPGKERNVQKVVIN